MRQKNLGNTGVSRGFFVDYCSRYPTIMQPVLIIQSSIRCSFLCQDRWKALADVRESLLDDDYYISYKNFDKGIRRGYYGDGVVHKLSQDESEEGGDDEEGDRRGSISRDRKGSRVSSASSAGASGGVRRKNSTSSLASVIGEDASAKGTLRRQLSNSSIGSGKSGVSRRKSLGHAILNIPPPLGNKVI